MIKQKISKWLLRTFGFFWIAFGLLTIAVIDYFSGLLMIIAGVLVMPSVISIIRVQAPRVKAFMVVILSVFILLLAIASVLNSMKYVQSSDYLPFDEGMIEVTEPKIL